MLSPQDLLLLNSMNLAGNKTPRLSSFSLFIKSKDEPFQCAICCLSASALQENSDTLGLTNERSL